VGTVTGSAPVRRPADERHAGLRCGTRVRAGTREVTKRMASRRRVASSSLSLLAMSAARNIISGCIVFSLLCV